MPVVPDQGEWLTGALRRHRRRVGLGSRHTRHQGHADGQARGDQLSCERSGPASPSTLRSVRTRRSAARRDHGSPTWRPQPALGVPRGRRHDDPLRQGGIRRPGRGGLDICVSQKGYLDIEFVAHVGRGASSNPLGGTSLERTARGRALAASKPRTRARKHRRRHLRALAPTSETTPFAGLVGDVRQRPRDRQEYRLRRVEISPPLSPPSRSGCLEGASTAADVMPEDVRATVNFRLLPGTTGPDVLAAVGSRSRARGVEARSPRPRPVASTPSTVQLRRAQGRSSTSTPASRGSRRFVCGGTELGRYSASAARSCASPSSPPRKKAPRHPQSRRAHLQADVCAGIRVLARLLRHTAFSTDF